MGMLSLLRSSKRSCAALASLSRNVVAACGVTIPSAIAGLPSDFYNSTADIYQHMAHFKDKDELPEIQRVLAALVDQSMLEKR